MTLPHEITLPSGEKLILLSIDPSPGELRGFVAEIDGGSMTTPEALFCQCKEGDWTAAMDFLTAAANDAHEQQEADEERDNASHRCGADIFSSPSSPS